MNTLKEIYEPYFKIGCAVNPQTVKTHRELITKHFNSLTCENEMKLGIIHPKKDTFDFSGADEIVSLGRQMGVKLRGHNFVWHQELADWVFADGKENALKYLEEHIKIISERYKDELYCFDVVNEAISDGDEFYRNTPWYSAFGENYLIKAFELAAKYLPSGCGLFYNDYNEADPNKNPKIISLVKKLISSGVKIDGVGLQTHLGLNCNFDEDEYKRALDEYANLGLRLHITEMDVAYFGFSDKRVIPPTPQMIKEQAETYKKCFKIFREYKEAIDSVTFWGVADDATWLNYTPIKRKNGGLIFDENHEPKEAFYAICDF